MSLNLIKPIYIQHLILLLAYSFFWHVLYHRKSALATDFPDHGSSFASLNKSTETPYALLLSNSGPAVLDSTIQFTAKLIKLAPNATDYEFFMFEWMNMANKFVNKTYTTGISTSALSLAFNSQFVSSGDYAMTVAVFPVFHLREMVAYNTMKFTLTDDLNGQIFIQQSLEYQRYPDVFATKQMTVLSSQVHDEFINPQEANFSYIWFKDFDILSQNKTVVHSFDEPTSCTIKAVIYTNYKFDKGQNMLLLPKDKLNHNVSSTFPSKRGEFKQFVVFKDSLVNCNVQHIEPAVKLGEPVVLNISCLGSAPSGICFNITGLNTTVPYQRGCQPAVFYDTVQHQITAKFSSTGWFDIHFFVYNDISRTHILKNFYVYDPDTLNAPVLVFPIVFGVFGIFVIAIGALYIMRLKKKPQVEVADFDFHPSLSNSRSDVSVRISQVIDTIKYWFSRHSDKHMDSYSSQKESLLQSEGAKVDFYDSL
ncbi:uncharacterized protein LOC131941337 [Physella acuta]|uniref:uncharacterized protein LOC131941337 n=1 Tax=Physella acuta TaxID=109671 RepID=UPI0027DC6EF7|nr:uncharacterized protein LOC131941337 [Physella acuta]